MHPAADSSLTQLQGWRTPAGCESNLEDCSLVVPTFRRPAEVCALLDTIGQLPDVPGEVVIVDGSDDEGTERAVASLVCQRDLGFQLIYVRSPPGLTRQRNVGIDASRGSLVFFLDDDCRPMPGYFRSIRDVFEADMERRVGVVCGSLINEMGEPLSVRWRLRFAFGLVPRTVEPARYYPTATSVPRSTVAPFTGTRVVDMVPGGASAYRRELLDSYRFSLFFDGYSQGEDLEMSLRVGREWELRWSGDAHVVHDHAPGGRPQSFTKGKMEVRNRYFIWKRYSPEPLLVHRVRFWGDITYIILWDLASSLKLPLSLHYIAHAAGCLRGAAECLVRPPRYMEPSPRREYDVMFSLAPSRRE